MIDAVVVVVVLVSRFAFIDVSARLRADIPNDFQLTWSSHGEKSINLNVIVPTSQASCMHHAVVISQICPP